MFMCDIHVGTILIIQTRNKAIEVAVIVTHEAAQAQNRCHNDDRKLSRQSSWNRAMPGTI